MATTTTIFRPRIAHLDFNAHKALSNLNMLSRGGLLPPNAADFYRMGDEMVVRIENVFRNLFNDHYQYRYQLLIDLVTNVFWRGRFAWRPRRLVTERWSEVLHKPHAYWLPDCRRISVLSEAPAVSCLKLSYNMLTPSVHCEIEDAAFKIIFDIMRQQPGDGSFAEIPQLEAGFAIREQKSLMVYAASATRGGPVFDDDEIAGCRHHDRYAQALLRFTMLLTNQYFWCSGEVGSTELATLQSDDRVIVCTK